jgi:dipeptidyl aminopeptidase/acylaminoacyl peptidase
MSQSRAMEPSSTCRAFLGVQIPRTLVWVDRQGREEPIKAPAGAYRRVRLSPDGTRVALEIRDQQQDIWIWDLARESPTRFTFEPTIDRSPVWTPDGQRILFGSGVVSSIFWRAADGTGNVERLTQSSNSQSPLGASLDSRRLVFEENVPPDIMMLTLDKDRKVQPLVQTSFAERNAEISPDGRWLAYESTESERAEVYVRPFPDVNAGRWLASTAGGTQPVWARSCQELFYLSLSGALMTVPIERGTTWNASTPAKLFDWRIQGGAFYDVSADGRFLITKPLGPDFTSPSSLVVVQHFDEELKRLVPTK